MSEELRLSRNQKLVLSALAAAAAPQSAYALLDALRAEGLRAPLQVYRALDKLIERGLVHRLETLNAFVACTHPEEHRHETVAFCICECCGRVEEWADGAVDRRLKAHARQHAFHVSRTTIEMRGRCGECVSG